MARAALRKGAFGLPLPEMWLVGVLVAILLGVLFERVDTLLERAEHARVEYDITQMRTTLRLEKARRLIAGETLDALVGTNPMLLGENYVTKPGEPSVPSVSEPLHRLVNLINSSEWSFDERSGTLYYRPERRRHLRLLDGARAPLLAWRIEKNVTAGEIDLRVVSAYQWF
ncbi:MAG: hypothetical protein REI09_14095 [Candidatus Dactylopiibacterium sp.]|nr:hypothetical protein [Candidatus Dactylopiibacterium sp.]